MIAFANRSPESALWASTTYLCALSRERIAQQHIGTFCVLWRSLPLPYISFGPPLLLPYFRLSGHVRGTPSTANASGGARSSPRKIRTWRNAGRPSRRSRQPDSGRVFTVSFLYIWAVNTLLTQRRQGGLERAGLPRKKETEIHLAQRGSVHRSQ
jgi:hypothetical protein